MANNDPQLTIMIAKMTELIEVLKKIEAALKDKKVQVTGQIKGV